MTPSELPSPSINTASLVASDCDYYQLVVDGENFNQDYTELYFEPLLRTERALKKVANWGYRDLCRMLSSSTVVRFFVFVFVQRNNSAEHSPPCRFRQPQQQLPL